MNDKRRDEAIMGNLLTYSGIITKTKAMSKNLIGPGDYDLISQMETPSELAAWLKRQPAYRALFSNLDENLLHRGQIEHIIKNSLYLAFSDIYRFASGSQREILKFLFSRYEVDILKECLQGIFRGQGNTCDLSLFEPFFNGHSALRPSDLCSCSTLAEFISALKNTRYYTLFTRLYNGGAVALYDYEVQLDVYYFTSVWKQMNKVLKGQERAYYSKILGIQIDLLNLMCIYRSKRFYDMEPARIYASIIPCHYKLTKNQVKEMVEASGVEESLSLIPSTWYKKMFQDFNAEYMEASYRKMISRIYAEGAKRHPCSMIPILYFLYRKEQELDRLTTALECIRYRLEPDKTLKYILEAS